MITEYPLPEGWKINLPLADHVWISKALFQFNKHSKVEMNFSKVDRLWWFPPQPALVSHQAPGIDRYFCHRLLLWMPRKLWQIRLTCPKSGCDGHHLTSAGLYRRVKQVLDINDFYIVGTEYLECLKCKSKYAGWSSVILNQLDIGHRLQFPIILTYR